MSLFDNKGIQQERVSVCPFQPVRKPRIGVGRHILQMGKQPTFLNCYPRNCNTDEDKLEYLKEGYFNHGFSMQVYFELVELLDVPDDIKFNDIIKSLKGDKK